LNIDYAKSKDAEIKTQILEWSEEMFSSNGEANINTVRLYTPLIQMANNELTSRFVKRTTIGAIGIAVLSLVVSLTALIVSYKTLT
jgi:hypothetical protein